MNWDCVRTKVRILSFTASAAKRIQFSKRLPVLPTEIVKRRVFVQITQGSSGGEVKLFERKENNKFTVTRWKREDTFKLLPKIDTTVFKNKGLHCVGQQVIAELQQDLKKPAEVKQDVDVPSPEAAFKESVQSTDGESVKTTVWILLLGQLTINVSNGTSLFRT